jgi:protease IV
MLNRIFSILGAQWLIHQDTAISYLPVLIAFMKGQDILTKPADGPKPYVVGWSNSEENIPTVKWYRLDDEEIAENSVAVIPIDGVICSWDSIHLMNLIHEAAENPRINSILFVVNSPGGMISQIDILANTIKGLSKPSVSVVMGMAASAAMWVISATNYRIATSPMDTIGSIGTKTSIQDYAGLLEKIGIKITDIYASLATRKDEAYRAFKDGGDTKLILDRVDFVNGIFHQAIQKNLNIPAESEIFTGADYFAAQAQSLGLINEINTMEHALTKAYELGLTNKLINQSKSINF